MLYKSEYGTNLVVEYMEQHAGNKGVQDIGIRDII